MGDYKVKTFFCFLLVFYPVVAMATIDPTPVFTTSNIPSVQSTETPSNEQFINPISFSVSITAKSKDINNSMIDMALNSLGEAYVLTGKSAELIHLDSDGNTKESSFIANLKANPWWRLDRFVVDKNGNFYFLDKAKGKIYKYDKTLTQLFTYSVNPKGLAEECHSLKIDPSGSLWLLQVNCKITKFDSNLSPLQTVALKPDMKLSYPTFFHSWDFTFDSKDNVYIITFENFILKFDDKGNFLKGFGGRGFKTGQLIHPEAITCGLDDCVYVSDASNDRVEKFSPNGEFITQWNLDEPMYEGRLSVDQNGDLWVLNGQQVTKFNHNLLEKDSSYFSQENLKRAETLPSSFSFTLDEKGNICEDFWKYTPYSPRFTESEFQVINAPCRLEPFAKLFGDSKFSLGQIAHFDPTRDDVYTEKVKQNFIQYEKDIKTLGSYGFDLSFDNVGGEDDLEIYQKTNQGFLWGFFKCLYFVPKDKPSQAFFITNDIEGLDEVKMEVLGNERYLFLIWYHGATGANRSMLNIYDLNLETQKISSIEEYFGGIQAISLKNNDHYNLIINQNVAESVVWPYLFSWNGREWVDTSDEFPDFYKTKAVEIISNIKYPPRNIEEQKEQQKVITALSNAALKGGPSAFGKYPHTPQIRPPDKFSYMKMRAIKKPKKMNSELVSPNTTPGN